MALSLGTNLDDPKTQALLALGLGLLGSRGSFGQSLSDAGQQALGVYNSGRQRQGTEELRALQKRQAEMGLLQAQRAMEEADNIKRTRGSFLDAIDPNAGPAMQPSLVGAMRAGFSPQEAAAFMPSRPESNFAKIDPKDYTPESLAEYVQTGNAAVLRPRTKMEFVDGQAVDPFSVKPGTVIQPRTPANNPWQDLLIPGPNGVPVPNSPLIDARRQIAAAGATNVAVNTTKPLLGTMAEGLGKQIESNLSAAKAATDTISGAQRIKSLLDTGQVVSGPGADWRIVARQVASVLRVGGKDNEEVLANTRRTIQQLANFELEAAQGMKGQGQITETEREILRRAAAGQITFTQTELRSLATALEDRARKRIRAHNQDVDRLSRMPEGAPLVPFYRVQEPTAPEASEAPLAPKPTKRWNPSKGQFEDVGG